LHCAPDAGKNNTNPGVMTYESTTPPPRTRSGVIYF
jgi:hypothetical protein